MCRLFAYVSPDPTTASHELGRVGIESLFALARLHGDGWGWAGVTAPGRPPVVRKSAGSAATDPHFRAAAATPAISAMMHLRWATSGLPVTDRNAHPFEVDGLAFEHNGSLKPIEALRALLSPDSLSALGGDTDSEMYFALIRERMGTGMPLEEAVADAVNVLRGVFPRASLNAILLDSHQLTVVHASARSSLAAPDLAELALHPQLPDEHNEDYFAMRWSHTPRGKILVGSTGVAGADWEELPTDSVTTIRLDDRSSTTIELSATSVARD